MTKRVLISLVLLLCALCISVTSYALLQNKIAALGQALENAVYTDLPVREVCGCVEQNADDCLVWFQILTPHKDMQELSVQLHALSDLRADESAYKETCRTCLRLLRELENEQRVNAENIL